MRTKRWGAVAGVLMLLASGCGRDAEAVDVRRGAVHVEASVWGIARGQRADVTITAQSRDRDVEIVSADLHRASAAVFAAPRVAQLRARTSDGALTARSMVEASDLAGFEQFYVTAQGRTRGRPVVLTGGPVKVDVVRDGSLSLNTCQALNFGIGYLLGGANSDAEALPFVPFLNFGFFEASAQPRASSDCDAPELEVPMAVVLDPRRQPPGDELDEEGRAILRAGDRIRAAVGAIAGDLALDSTDVTQLQAIARDLRGLAGADPAAWDRLLGRSPGAGSVAAGIGVGPGELATGYVVPALLKNVRQVIKALTPSGPQTVPGPNGDAGVSARPSPLLEGVSWREFSQGWRIRVAVDEEAGAPLELTAGMCGVGIDLEIWRDSVVSTDRASRSYQVREGLVRLDFEEVEGGCGSPGPSFSDLILDELVLRPGGADVSGREDVGTLGPVAGRAVGERAAPTTPPPPPRDVAPGGEGSPGGRGAGPSTPVPRVTTAPGEPGQPGEPGRGEGGSGEPGGPGGPGFPPQFEDP